MQSEAASSISSGLSIVGKIIGHGALTIFGHVEGEVRASTIVIAEGAHIEGKVSAEELTIGGCVTGTIHANRVQLNSTAVVAGDIFHRTLVIEGSDAKGSASSPCSLCRCVVTITRASGCGPCGVSILTLSVIARAASTPTHHTDLEHPQLPLALRAR